jgi:hypothetical protein
MEGRRNVESSAIEASEKAREKKNVAGEER